MSSRNDIEVVIGGKVIKLVGYESEEYLQKIAAYINGKLAEYDKVDSFKRQPIEMQNVLIQLNIADDYFKAKKQLDELTEEMELKDKELYDIKHELIATQIKMESKDKMIRDYQKELTKVELARAVTDSPLTLNGIQEYAGQNT